MLSDLGDVPIGRSFIGNPVEDDRVALRRGSPRVTLIQRRGRMGDLQAVCGERTRHQALAERDCRLTACTHRSCIEAKVRNTQ